VVLVLIKITPKKIITMKYFMTPETIYISVILLVIVITWRLNKKFDDDPIKDFLRIIAAVLTTLGILFFWNWL
jgi:hypothetical protein